MLYKAVSVHIRISCLALSPPTIWDPDESLNDPAVFVEVGSQSVILSWEENAINNGSMFPVLALPEIASAPKTITWRSISLTIVWRPFVGDKFAPDKVVMSTARLLNPDDSSQ